MKMKGAVDEARRKRLTHAGGRRTTQPTNPNQRGVERVKTRIAWDLAGSAFKNRVLGLLVVEESEIAFARIKIDFMVLTALHRIPS